MSVSTTLWVLIATVFSTFFAISWIYKNLGITNLEKALKLRNGLVFLNMKHALGIMIFGVFFYLSLPQLQHTVNTIEIAPLNTLIPYLILLFVCAFLAYRSAGNIENDYLDRSPYTLSSAWSYFIIRLVFLLAYEFFFRIVILFSFLEYFSISEAIAYNTLLYVLIHAFDSRKEIIGAIPFGIVLCLFAYLTQSVWYAFIMHATLSTVYEITIFFKQTKTTLLS
ncbi:CPBP family intramembrane glutamic endopeptidase [Gaetbulibacter aestuarii]|uniref:CPBP family intramembrane glutamic endopeptidase n=1 Tax=Gaetbulibacter aestuarii TaxID=1502358 RepID=A0ABW7MY10_9FLAO